VIYLLILLLLTDLTCSFIYLFTSAKIDLFHFQAGGYKRRPNPALVFVFFILSGSIFCCMLAFVVLDFVFFSTKPRDWLRRMSPKRPVPCLTSNEVDKLIVYSIKCLIEWFHELLLVDCVTRCRAAKTTTKVHAVTSALITWSFSGPLSPR